MEPTTSSVSEHCAHVLLLLLLLLLIIVAAYSPLHPPPPHPIHATSSRTAFVEGDVIELVTKEHADEGWWVGKTEDGKQGAFPANHVECVACVCRCIGSVCACTLGLSSRPPFR